jgi:7-cyano-7-deazaguanine synthase in queuosine biosynthesis
MATNSAKRVVRGSFIPTPPDAAQQNDFGTAENLAGLNALVIGNAAFEAERILRDERIRRIIIPFYYSGELDYDFAEIGALVHELLVFTLVEDIEVVFRPERRIPLASQQPDQGLPPALCLFSGGTDSYAGVLLAKRVFADLKAVFCAHSDQSRIIHIVSTLARHTLLPNGIELIKAPVPSIGARGYAQLRGFLYLLAASARAQQIRSDTIVVTECGPTMYQPRFSPFDSITMTTHPFVVRTAARLATLLLNREIKIVTPFENLTKAEVIAVSPEKKGLKLTHSCISQRFGKHDGTCYGCVIRRLATTAAGVTDVKYGRNPINDSGAHAGNLYSLLTFCYEVLTDFNGMEEYEIGTINDYRKRDLFRRFALDNFAAIRRLLSENKRVVRPIRDMFTSLAQKLGTSVFDQRLRELKDPTVVPDFNKLAD